MLYSSQLQVGLSFVRLNISEAGMQKPYADIKVAPVILVNGNRSTLE